MAGANEDAFLGGLLGLAIGDALGMPVVGQSRAEIAARHNRIAGFLPRVFADGTEIGAGEFTDETEIALCVVESASANAGQIDPENIGARMVYLARGESKRWLAAATRAALERADETLTFRVPLDEDGPATGDVAARGAPIGLLHAVGAFDPEALRADVEAVVRVTHGSPAAIAAATAVAVGVRLATRGETPRAGWARATADFLDTGEMAAALRHAAEIHEAGTDLAAAIATIGTGAAATEVVPAAFVAAMGAATFEDAVLGAANAGGATDSVGAIAGVLAGAAAGARGLPQRLIDDLEGRIYVSLAAPWFYRAAQRRAGLVIDLRLDGPGPPDPRPLMPPRQ